VLRRGGLIGLALRQYGNAFHVPLVLGAMVSVAKDTALMQTTAKI
jgi:hypothetical protein